MYHIAYAQADAYTLCISKAQAEAYMFNNKQVKF